MSLYTLSINIKSDNKELLDNLMVTLETINGSLSDVEAVELYTTGNGEHDTDSTYAGQADPSTIQRDLFLDKWTLSETL